MTSFLGFLEEQNNIIYVLLFLLPFCVFFSCFLCHYHQVMEIEIDQEMESDDVDYDDVVVPPPQNKMRPMKRPSKHDVIVGGVLYRF